MSRSLMELRRIMQTAHAIANARTPWELFLLRVRLWFDERRFRNAMRRARQPVDRTDEAIARELAVLRSPEAQAQHAAWLATTCSAVRELAKRYPFDQAYRVTDAHPLAGSIVGLASYFESGEVRVNVLRCNGLPGAHDHAHVIDPGALVPHEMRTGRTEKPAPTR